MIPENVSDNIVCQCYHFSIRKKKDSITWTWELGIGTANKKKGDRIFCDQILSPFFVLNIRILKSYSAGLQLLQAFLPGESVLHQLFQPLLIQSSLQCDS